MKSLLRLFFSRKPSVEADLSDESYAAVTSYSAEELIREGNRLEDQRDHAGALELYQRAVALSPQSASAQLNLGNVQTVFGRTADAENCYQRAIELDSDCADAYFNLGTVLLARQAVDEAERNYRCAIRARPGWAEAWAGLGCLLEMKSELVEADAAFRKALTLNPGHAGSASRLANLLKREGHASDALQILSSTLQSDPNNPVALRTRAEINAAIGAYAEAIADFRKVLVATPHDFASYSNLLWTLNFMPDIPAQEILAEHAKFGELIERVSSTDKIASSAVKTKKLRIGYVSADFRNHPIACFVEPLLRHHDRQQFEIHCFYNHDTWDTVTRHLSNFADRWHNIAGIEDAEVAEAIALLGIEILVDLSGHTAHNRLGLFALKPAPIQFTWLGYLCTTGMRSIDYRICDAYTDPQEIAEHWQVEEPVRLPDSQWCYQPLVELPPATDLPMLANGYWTFGSFNQESKLNSAALEAWCRVLVAFPDSRLRVVGVSYDLVEERIRRCVQAYGIAAERVEVLGRIPIESYFACYCGVDIALDTFPYNGATTTCDALIMGVPVLTVAGNRSIARGGISLLTTLGLSDWVARSAEDIVERLRVLTAEPQCLASLRLDLPARVRASALMDGARFARNLENVFLQASVCANQPR